MSIGGGEILRAVMSDPANVADYAPSFYVIPLNADNGAAGSASFKQTGFLQCKKDKYFLMTGVVPTATNTGGAGTGFLRGSEPEFVSFFDPAQNDQFLFAAPLQADLFSETSYNWSFTFPEYIMWLPASLIGVEWTGRNFNATVDFKFLTLVGIEFGMKG